MLLANQNAIIYGGAGAVGGAIALAFARAGARLFLAGRNLTKLEHFARRIRSVGGVAEAAAVDALDEGAVERHAAEVVAVGGSLDVSFNAVGVTHAQSMPLLELAIADVMHPIHTYAATHFLTSRAAARHMVPRRSGVIMTVTVPATADTLGSAAASAAVESISRLLAAEVAPHGVRVVCLRPDAQEAPTLMEIGEAAVQHAARATPGLVVDIPRRG